MPSLIVRPLVSAEEYDTYYRLADAAFSPKPSEDTVQRRLRLATLHPDLRAEQVRGAFREDQLMGGYVLYERVLCMGAARLAIGCIGTVVTVPNYRKHGVATALLQDALDRARKKHLALLLLDGILKFYFRYGYIDLFDVSALEIDLSAILAHEPSAYHVRPATIDDAPALLALYQRHFQTYTGYFERSLDFQIFCLQMAQTPPVVALSPQGQIEGYLFHGTDDDIALGREMVTENGEALLALLHYHAHLLDAAAVNTLQYMVPLNTPITQSIIDTLEVPDTAQWRDPAREWVVRSQTYHHRFAGWMGSLSDFPTLMHSILPELQARWQRSLAHWTGEFALTVDGQLCVLRLDNTNVQLADDHSAAAYRLELTPQALLQWVFGYRPLSRFTGVAPLAKDASAALAILFPLGHTWIPGTDWF